MKKEEILQLNALVNEIFTLYAQDATINAKFLYAMKRNGDLVKPLAEAIIKEIIPTEFKDREKTLEYEMTRTTMCREYSQKDEKGEPIINGNKYEIMIDKQQEFNDKINELNEKFKEVLEEKQQQLEVRDKILKEEVEGFEPYKIKLEYVPETGFITPEIMTLLYHLIDQ